LLRLETIKNKTGNGHQQAGNMVSETMIALAITEPLINRLVEVSECRSPSSDVYRPTLQPVRLYSTLQTHVSRCLVTGEEDMSDTQ